MTDKLSSAARSANMSRIRSTNTSPELIVRKLIHSWGYRYRLHVRTLPGKPDIVLPRLRKIIDVRGCFWHQHPGCVDSHVPRSRQDYWKPKLSGNTARDKSNALALRRLGWKVLVVWECEVTKRSLAARVRRFLSLL